MGTAAGDGAGSGTGTGPGAGPFEAATGDGPPPSPGTAGRRAAEVRTAFEGLRQIRRVMRTEGPAAWERERPLQAVPLALEASGFPPSAVDPATGRRTATGYLATPGGTPGGVRVEWVGPPGSGAGSDEARRLAACADRLAELGWQSLLYRGPHGRRFLEVEPPPG
ncbi:hypothetical protein [Streptomyces sp. NPDC048603]|uniref:hypothetical protein n=1 Tax=Streptomyces sp. NPDC048603 TaxID=3365577 RepID=UPI0037133200